MPLSFGEDMNRYFAIGPGFLRIWHSPHRFVIAHKNRALYSVRCGGWRVFDWYFYFGA